jgi:hypothetical protein
VHAKSCRRNEKIEMDCDRCPVGETAVRGIKKKRKAYASVVRSGSRASSVVGDDAMMQLLRRGG